MYDEAWMRINMTMFFTIHRDMEKTWKVQSMDQPGSAKPLCMSPSSPTVTGTVGENQDTIGRNEVCLAVALGCYSTAMRGELRAKPLLVWSERTAPLPCFGCRLPPDNSGHSAVDRGLPWRPEHALSSDFENLTRGG